MTGNLRDNNLRSLTVGVWNASMNFSFAANSLNQCPNRALQPAMKSYRVRSSFKGKILLKVMISGDVG